MKVKASFTISKDTLSALDRLVGKNGNRSAFVENALNEAIRERERAAREAKDTAIYNAHWREIYKEVKADQDLLRALAREDERREKNSRPRCTSARARG